MPDSSSSERTASAATDPTVQLQVDFLGRAYDVVLQALAAIKFDAGQVAHLYVLALHASIVEMTAGCIALLDAGVTTPLPLLLRSMQEASVDLDNLLADAAYAKSIEATNHKEMLKLLRQAQKDENPYLAGMSSLTDISGHIGTLESRLGQLGEEGREPLRVIERFQMAGRLHEYRSIYALFALDTHNNLAALVGRHIAEYGGGHQVTVFSDPPRSSMHARLDAITATLVQSALHVHRAFQSGHSGVEAIWAEFDAMRRALIEHSRTDHGTIDQ